ncbi:MAG: hypothetical protein RL235_748 [Chlamydiota bacterium]|jgi:DNA repair protein RadC
MSSSFRDLPSSEKPRERLIRHGASALSTIELLALLINAGSRTRSVIELASDLLARFGSIEALREASLEELCQIKGIGKAKAVQLKAAFALATRSNYPTHDCALDKASQVFALIHLEMATRTRESLMVILRDVRAKLIHREIIGDGTLNQLLLHPREVFHAAIKHRAHTVMIAHNHPSGDPSPSQKDIEMTNALALVGRMVGIPLADHIIVGLKTYFSFRDAQMMPI